MSNVTRKSYTVVSPSCSMKCATENVISCKKCRIQYIGETSQKLRNRMNNHRNRMRNLKRQPRKRRKKIEINNLTESLEKLLDNYKSCHFLF